MSERRNVVGAAANVRADVVAGMLTALVAIPQAIAIGVFAGMSPTQSLLALTLPALAYVAMTPTRLVSVGPVYVLALLVADVATARAPVHGVDAIGIVAIIAVECGVWCLLFAALRVGASIHIVSHAVVVGVLNGTALLVIMRELPVLMGQAIAPGVIALPDLAVTLSGEGLQTEAALFSAGALVVLLVANAPRWRGPGRPINTVGQLAPLAVVAAAMFLHPGESNARTDANVWSVSVLHAGYGTLWISLLPASLLTATIAYFHTQAVSARLPAMALHRQDTQRQLVALGAANIASGLLGSMPVAGGPNRSMSLLAFGARTSGSVVVLVLAAALLSFAGQWLARVPASAWSVIAVWFAIRLFDFSQLKSLWRLNRGDVVASAVAMTTVALFGVMTGAVLGFIASVAFYMFRAGRPVVTEIGRLGDSVRFRSTRFFSVQTWPQLLLVRVDASVYFANAANIERRLLRLVERRPGTRSLVLDCSAISQIDSTGVAALERLQRSLALVGVNLHLCAMRGDVLARIAHTDVVATLSGNLHDTMQGAVDRLLAHADAALKRPHST